MLHPDLVYYFFFATAPVNEESSKYLIFWILKSRHSSICVCRSRSNVGSIDKRYAKAKVSWKFKYVKMQWFSVTYSGSHGATIKYWRVSGYA